MIPNLDSRGRQSETVPWIKTKADTELSQCNAITIRVAGREFPVWKFIEMYLRIMGKSGERLAFRLNDAQIKTYKVWDAQMAGMGYVRCNEGKGRQMGSSTLIAALLWTMLITHPGYKVGILADTEEKGIGLLQKYRFFYLNMPREYREALSKACVTDNSHMLSFDFGEGIVSSVQVIVAGKNAGASYTFQALHDSEVALWEDIDATLMALEQTVGDERETIIIRETTARGPNEWKGHYEQGKNGRSEFVSIFLAWYLMDGYSKPYDGHDLNEYERFLRDTVGLSLDQIQWWKSTFNKANNSLQYMKQEYPSTEEEMWQSTSICIFDAELVAKRKAETVGKWLFRGDFEYEKPTYDAEEVGSTITLEPRAFIKDPIGRTTIFALPVEGHPYAVVNDPANGGEDYNATLVFDCSSDALVATYHARRVDADEAAFQAYCLYLCYRDGGIPHKERFAAHNRVYVSGERNTSTYFLRLMQRLGCDVVRDRSDGESSSMLDHLGWRTTPANRQNMIDTFKVCFHSTAGRTVPDYELLCEMENFQYRKSGIQQREKAQAIGGAHDDLVMAACGYFHCKERGDFECNVLPPRRKGTTTVAFDPFRKATPQRETHFVNW